MANPHDDASSDSSDDGAVCIKICAPSGPLVVNLCHAELESITVLGFKEILSPKLGWPADRIMLVCSGKDMDDSSRLSTYGISDGSKIIASKELGCQTSHDGIAGRSQNVHSRDDFLSNLLHSGSPGGSTGTPLSLYPGHLRSILDNQAVNSALQSPEFIKNFLARESSINRMFEQNQELMQILNDSELLRQITDTIKNPKLMQEVMRNNDRQLSNVEAIPGGLNILSGLYQNLQESTNFEPFDKSTDSLNNEFARNLGVKKRQMNEINHESLPNPWISRKSGDPAKSKNGIFALKDDMVDSLLDFYDPSLMPGKRNTAETPSSFLAPSSFMGVLQLLSDISGSLDSPRPGPKNGDSPSVLKGESPESLEQPPASSALSQQEAAKEGAVQETTLNDQDLVSSLAEPPAASGSAQQKQPQGDVSAEERYALEIRLLMEMGFSKKEDCISALLAAGGSVEGAVAYLKCISFPQDNSEN